MEKQGQGMSPTEEAMHLDKEIETLERRAEEMAEKIKNKNLSDDSAFDNNALPSGWTGSEEVVHLSTQLDALKTHLATLKQRRKRLESKVFKQ